MANYIDMLMKAFLMIFRKFPTTFWRFPKIFQNFSEGQTNVPEHFPGISENFRRGPKIAEDFRGRPEDVSMIHQRIKVQFKRQTWYQWKSSINSRARLWKINHSGPGCTFYEFYERYIYRLTHSASELSGFTCTSSLTMNEKFQYRNTEIVKLWVSRSHGVMTVVYRIYTTAITPR